LMRHSLPQLRGSSHRSALRRQASIIAAAMGLARNHQDPSQISQALYAIVLHVNIGGCNRLESS
jgi:hypothetical protein